MENENFDINTENAECCADETCAERDVKAMFAEKCAKAKSACKETAERIARDLKETDYNPYFKRTKTYKLEVYRQAGDETPIDTFECTDTKAFSAKALAIAGAATAVLAVIANGIFKKDGK